MFLNTVHALPLIDAGRPLPAPTLRECAFYFAGHTAARNVCGAITPPCELVAGIAARVIQGEAISAAESQRLIAEVEHRHERSIEFQQIRRRLVRNEP